MKYQHATKPVQKEQSKTPPSLSHQTSLNRIAVHPPPNLQRTIGNQAVQNRLRSGNTQSDPITQTSIEPHFGHDFSQIPVHSPRPSVLQTKLAVNQPGNVYEREADQIAGQVMRIVDSEPPVSDDEDEAKDSLMRKRSIGAHTATDIPSVPPLVHDVLNSGGGQPLDTTIRVFMEPRFGHDFSQVRVHTDERAVKSAQAVNALAYTIGHNIAFGAGWFAPGTQQGRWLIAHELTHVVQKENLKSDPHAPWNKYSVGRPDAAGRGDLLGLPDLKHLREWRDKGFISQADFDRQTRTQLKVWQEDADQILYALSVPPNLDKSDAQNDPNSPGFDPQVALRTTQAEARQKLANLQSTTDRYAAVADFVQKAERAIKLDEEIAALQKKISERKSGSTKGPAKP